MRLARELIISVVLALALFFGIDAITARSYVEGQSMEPNLHRDQVLLISRLGMSGLTGQAFAFFRGDDLNKTGGWVPPRGSIVTFAHPTDPSRVLVKRLIGLPGDTIAIENGTVFVNGQQLDEPYVTYHDGRSVPPLTVPDTAIYVLGDNRPASNDSRSFGPVPRSNLVGVAILRYWPIREFKLLIG